MLWIYHLWALYVIEVVLLYDSPRTEDCILKGFSFTGWPWLFNQWCKHVVLWFQAYHYPTKDRSQVWCINYPLNNLVWVHNHYKWTLVWEVEVCFCFSPCHGWTMVLWWLYKFHVVFGKWNYGSLSCLIVSITFLHKIQIKRMRSVKGKWLKVLALRQILLLY